MEWPIVSITHVWCFNIMLTEIEQQLHVQLNMASISQWKTWKKVEYQPKMNQQLLLVRAFCSSIFKFWSIALTKRWLISDSHLHSFSICFVSEIGNDLLDVSLRRCLHFLSPLTVLVEAWWSGGAALQPPDTKWVNCSRNNSCRVPSPWMKSHGQQLAWPVGSIGGLHSRSPNPSSALASVRCHRPRSQAARVPLSHSELQKAHLFMVDLGGHKWYPYCPAGPPVSMSAPVFSPVR